MKFLADENLDTPIIDVLRGANHQVDIVLNIGVDDSEVLQQSNQSQAVLITQDKDFGELVYRNNLHHVGIILVRLEGLSPSNKAKRVLEVVDKHEKELENAFTVIQDKFLRIRKK